MGTLQEVDLQAVSVVVLVRKAGEIAILSEVHYYCDQIMLCL